MERVRKLVRKLVRGQFVEVGSHLLQGILITNDDGDDDDDDDDNNNNNNRNNSILSWNSISPNILTSRCSFAFE